PRAQGRRLRLALRAQILDAPLDIGETAARLLLPRPRLRQPLLESRPLGQQRAGARLEPRDLVARPLPLVLQRAPRRLGIRVRRRVRLLRRARRGQGALEVGLGRRGGALGRGLQLLLRPLLARGGLAQLGRQQVALALPLAHLRRPARGRGLGLREARPELLELHRPRGRISLPLLAQRADLALQLGNLCARLHVAEAGLLQPLLEAPPAARARRRTPSAARARARPRPRPRQGAPSGARSRPRAPRRASRPPWSRPAPARRARPPPPRARPPDAPAPAPPRPTTSPAS